MRKKSEIRVMIKEKRKKEKSGKGEWNMGEM